MSWDIHGQPLAAGHCEVHPSVPESYPCSQCRDENDQAEADRAYQEQEQQAYDQWAAQQQFDDDLPPF